MEQRSHQKLNFRKIFLAALFGCAIFILLPAAHASAATRTIANGGGNWSAIGTWVEGAVPIAGDLVVATATSGSLTVDVSTAAVGSFILTGFPGTSSLIVNNTLNVAGSVTLASGMTITTSSGTPNLTVTATGTITSNAVTWPYAITFGGTSQTYTLASNLNMTGNLTLTPVTALTFTGAFTLNVGGNLSTAAGIQPYNLSGGAAIIVSGSFTVGNNTSYNGGTITVGGSISAGQTVAGSTLFVMNGTGTFSATLGWRFSITFNTTGTITIGNIPINGGTVTYVAGTMNITGTLTLGVATTLNTSGMTGTNTWNNVTFGGTSITYTLASDLNINGLLTFSGTTATTISGTHNINANGGMTQTVATVTISTGTLVLGGGTWTASGVALVGNLTFAGNVIVSSGGNHIWGTGTLLYSSGTITTAGSTLLVTSGTINTSGMTWNNVQFNGGATLGQDLNLSNNLTFSGTTGTISLSGAVNINVGGNVTTSGTTAIFGGTPTIVMKATAGVGTGTLSTPSSTQLRNPLTFNSTSGTIVISGTVNYNTGKLTYTSGTMTVAGSILNVGATTTIDTNTMHWNDVTLNGTSTITLNSDLNVDGTLTLGSTTLTTTINGPGNLNASGSITQSGTASIINGTATIVMNGTGIWSSTSNSAIRNNMTLSGTITITGTVVYSVGTLTISGTITNGVGSNLQIGSGTLTINAANISFTAISFINAVGTLTINGTNGFTVGTMTSPNAGSTINWESTKTYTITGALTIAGTAAAHTSFVSSVGASQAIVIVQNGATQNVSFVNATDIDSSAGQTIRDFKGILSNATNWTTTGLTTVVFTYFF